MERQQGQRSPRYSPRERADYLRAIRDWRRILSQNPENVFAGVQIWDHIWRIELEAEATAALKHALRQVEITAKRAERRLDATTLCCVDCSDPDLAARAMQLSLSECSFHRALLLTDQPVSFPGIDTERIDRIENLEQYADFMIKKLGRFIDSDFVLVVQWDGYVLNASRWRDEFLLFDYVGARWPHHDDAYIVGNGGFSLRSRELLKALQDPEIRPFDPEDGAICRTYRPMLESRYGITFAPHEVADRFAFEYIESVAPTFGFHGALHVARFVDDPQVKSLAFLDPLIERWSDTAGDSQEEQ